MLLVLSFSYLLLSNLILRLGCYPNCPISVSAYVSSLLTNIDKNSCWYMAAFSQYRFQLSTTLLLISFPRNFQHRPQAFHWTSPRNQWTIGPRFLGKFLDTFWFVEILHRLRTGECESPFIQLGFQKVSTGYIISLPATIKRTSIFFQPKNDHQKKHLK